jgi:hypothetical protein
MRYRGAIGWLIGLTVMLAAPSAAFAATVTNTADSGAGSLRDAIAAAASGATIDFSPALNGQTITLTSGPLMVTQSLTISGPGAGNLTITNATVNGSADFNINIVPPTSSSVTISGLTITGGRARDTSGGGIDAESVATLTLDGDVITGNQATIRDNRSSAGGGGVFVNGGTVNVSNSTITNNAMAFNDSVGGNGSSGGGGIYSNGGTITVANSDVSRNSVSQSTSSGDSGGGGIYSNGGDVEIDNTTVRSNSDAINTSSGGDDGGGGVNSAGGAVTLNNATIDGNSFTLTSSTGGNNGGGGVYDSGGDFSMVFSTIDGNSATVGSDSGGDNGGGGLLSEGGSIGVGFSSISSNAFSVTDNTGGDNGGGAILDEGGGGTFLQSTLADNSVTVSGTSGDNGGGAIYNFGPMVISSLTIAGNSSNVPAGAILNRSSIQLQNTLIAGNTATPAGNCGGFGGTFTSDGFNLESANTCGLDSTKHDLINTAQPLGPLQNNGGPTPTRALPAGSPAVDAGTCTDIVGGPVPIDQRGVARPQPAGGMCDIGAFELVPSSQPPPPPPSKPTASLDRRAATSTTGASFSGIVNPGGQATTVVFQYGIDARFRPGGGSGIVYDQSTQPQALPADSTNHTVTVAVSGLVPNALYHVRVVATNAIGTTVGPDQTFTTPADPAPPAPVLAKNVDAKPVSGKVFVLVGGKLVPLTEADQLRAGTIVDTRTGSLQLTTASSEKHKKQIGTFGGAIFKITQVHSGLTTLSLVENALKGAPSFASCKSKQGKAVSAAVSSKTLQLLHSSAKGKFRTKGRYAAATVRGTKWTIADRCDGTLTHDITDSVVVNDFVRHKTIVLHAGHSYLALAQPPKKKKK